MNRNNWPFVCLLTSLTLSSHPLIAAVSQVPTGELQTLLSQDKIAACETFCVQTVEVFNEFQEKSSINIVATNNLSVSAELKLSVSVTNITPGPVTAVEATVPAQTSFYVYQGNVVSKSSSSKHTNSYQFYPGTGGATHDNDVEYELPWEHGKRHQSLNGRPDYFEFEMDASTPVLAARSGIVVGVKDKKDIRSFSPSQNHDANEVFILHDDQTIGVYRNLAQNGALVEIGDGVEQGGKIAFSGQTGNAVLPMLTFYVTTPPVSGESEFVDIKFITREGVFSSFADIADGCKYTAVHANGTIDPDLSFENDPGLGSNGSVTTGGSTAGSTDSGSGCTVTTTPDTGTGTDNGTDNGTDTGTDTGTGTGSGTDTGTDTGSGSSNGGSQPAASGSKGGGGGTTSPLLLLIMSALYVIRRKAQRA